MKTEIPDWLWKANGIAVPAPEHRFHPTRKWRFDYAWPDKMVALELEGGLWARGRHTRGGGYIADMAKYNAATEAGWRVLRYAPNAVDYEQVKRVLSASSR